MEWLAIWILAVLGAIWAGKQGWKKSSTDKVLGGVCAGIAKQFQTTTLAIRLLFVLLGFAGGISVVAYICLALILESD